MARFDVYMRRESTNPPFLLSVQSDYHRHLHTCVVVPLMPEKAARPRQITRLMPTLEVDGKAYIMETPEIAAVPLSKLGKKIGSLDNYHYEITSAVDFLMQGF